LKNDLNVEVFEPEIITSVTPKPYIVIRNVNQSGSNINQGFDNYYNIYVYCNKGDKTTLDILKNNVISSLHNNQISSGTTKNTLHYQGFVTQEFYDENFDASGQGLVFQNDTIIE
jgi:hypothetical protein